MNHRSFSIFDSSQDLAPIALFVYNRPEHTRRTLHFLKQNVLASDSMLFVFSDGPKTTADINLVKGVRKIIQRITGFKSVQIIEREKNYGLSHSIISGVSRLIKKYQKLIIFEDDLISSAYTLTYFNDALSIYESEERIMHIGAYMYPIDKNGLTETFFYRAASSWGWGTWARAWNYFETDIHELIRQFDCNKIEQFSIDNKMDFWRQMQAFKNGKNDSWAIRWYASIFLNGGLTLNPAQSLIQNIGHDGSGMHSGKNKMYDAEIYSKPIQFFPKDIQENEQAYEAIKTFLATRKGNLLQRIIRFLSF